MYMYMYIYIYIYIYTNDSIFPGRPEAQDNTEAGLKYVVDRAIPELLEVRTYRGTSCLSLLSQISLQWRHNGHDGVSNQLFTQPFV